MKLTEMFPSNLLKAQDVTDAGGEMPLKIFNVEIKEFDGDGGKERKPILIFTDDRRMVLNKTNANIIAEMFGDDTDLCINKEITLHVQSVEFQGKLVPSIRVKLVNEKDALIQKYWAKVRELGLERADGVKILKECGNDFAAAFEKIASNPF